MPGNGSDLALHLLIKLEVELGMPHHSKTVLHVDQHNSVGNDRPELVARCTVDQRAGIDNSLSTGSLRNGVGRTAVCAKRAMKVPGAVAARALLKMQGVAALSPVV